MSSPRLRTALIALALGILPLDAAADIYTWTDAQGVVHISSRADAPNAKLAVKSAPAATGARAGVTPFSPQDRDPSRYTRFDEYIRQAATLYQIPEPLVRAVIKVESDYNPRAVSSAGAHGLMQLMPETAERMQVRDINNPRENIFGGVRYLRVLANMFNGDLNLTVAAYNAGEHAVMNHGGIPPFAETKDYVVKVTKFYRRYRTIPDAVDASLAPPEPVQLNLGHAGPALKRVALVAALLAWSVRAEAQPPRLEVQNVAETGSMPKGVSLSPDGERAYVTNFGMHNGQNIDIYDARTLVHLDAINVQGNIVETALSADGKTIFASNFLRNSVQFIDTKSKRVRTEIPTGAHPKILVLSSDGTQLFAANWSGNSITQIDVATAKVVRTIPAGANPRGMAMTRAGALYAANFNGASIDVFLGASLGQHHRVAACPIPRHLALTPDEKLLFVSCYHDSRVDVLDVGSEKVVHTLHVGSSPKSIEVSRDGRYAWSADYGKETNSVSVIDTDDWTARVFPVPGMDHGSGLTLYPDGKHALVTGWYDNHVYLVGFEGTGGDPAGTLVKIDRWSHRPKHD